jgi:TetR/AcrR family transcriptional regulator, regulator of cefoperazone and chloramphenicol sensitivity
MFDKQNIRTITARAEDLTPRARIREAALELFADRGPAATSIRAVAQRVGVSANLVIHYFGSKDGLRDAVDEAAVTRFATAFAAAAQSADSPEKIARACAQEIARLAREQPYLGDYLARSLVEGREPAARLFDGLLALTKAELSRVRELGAVRTTTDIDVQALQAVCRWLSPVLLRPLLDRHLPGSLYSEEQTRRWLDAQADLLEHGLIKGPPKEQGR